MRASKGNLVILIGLLLLSTLLTARPTLGELPTSSAYQGRTLHLTSTSLAPPFNASLSFSGPVGNLSARLPRVFVMSQPIQSLGASVLGKVSFFLWLSADKSVNATIKSTLLTSLEFGSASQKVPLNQTAAEHNLNFTIQPTSGGGIPLTIGDRISVSVEALFTGQESANVTLHWGSPNKDSRLVVPFTNYASVERVRISDFGNNENKTFNLFAPTGFNLVNIQTTVRDVFGPDLASLGGDVSRVNITITGPHGRIPETTNIDTDAPFRSQPGTSQTYIFKWYYPSDSAEGSYLVDVDLVDAQGNLIKGVGGPHSFGLGILAAPFPLLTALVSGGGLGVAGLLTGVVYARRRRRREYLAPFSHFEQMTKGEIPGGSMVTVEGNTGAGKTMFCSQLMYEELKRGRPCVFVAADDFPDRIRENMRSLGMDVTGYEKTGLLTFVDCYSAEAGRLPTEKLAVSSLGDLTSLGVKISSALQEQKGTNLFLDSLSPFVPRTKPESIVSFVHTVGAKVRGLGGKAFFTMSTGTDVGIQGQLEDMADCVVQMEAFEEKDVRRRRLRVRKFRTRRPQEGWSTFTIEDGKGIIFYTKKTNMPK